MVVAIRAPRPSLPERVVMHSSVEAGARGGVAVLTEHVPFVRRASDAESSHPKPCRARGDFGAARTSPRRLRVHAEPCRPRAPGSRARAKAGRPLPDVNDAPTVAAVVVIEVRQVRANRGDERVDGAGGHGGAMVTLQRGGLEVSSWSGKSSASVI